MNEKKLMRKQMIKILKEITKPLYEDYSYKIANQLYQDEDWRQANVIGITVSKFPEVDTYQIIRKAWEQGKKVVVPKCYPQDKKMIFYLLTEFSQLESVFFGLLEPKDDCTEAVDARDINLMIVPGLAYTKEGYRIGFGGGYYDRYLKNYTGKTLTLAFDVQIIPQFKMEEYDMPVSKIITNNETIKVK
jgi:5-formyltetrahydrofolate cyclo-ligase